MQNKNHLQIFDFNRHDIRAILKDGEPWFVLKDLCDILEIGNPSDVAKSLFEGTIDSIEVSHFSDNKWDGNKLNIVNEAGMYQVIFQSRKENAKEFQRWVTSEVLPSIRKTGSYSQYDLDRDHSEVYKVLQEVNRQKGATKFYHFTNLGKATKGKDKLESLKIRSQTLMSVIKNFENIHDYKELRLLGIEEKNKISFQKLS